MKKITSNEKITQIIFFIAGVVLNSLSVAIFLAPHNLASAGLSGIAIILEYLAIEIGVGWWILILNIPLLVLGVFFFSIKFSVTTILGVALSSILTEFLAAFSYNALDGVPFSPNPLVSAIVGGGLIGAAVGCAFRANSSLGGLDIIVKILRQKYRHMKTGGFYIFTGSFIILAGAIVFGDHSLIIYATIVLVSMSFFTNAVLYGGDGARMVYIITNNDSNISKRLNDELETGVTYIRGTGSYTGAEKKILLCAMRSHTLPKAREIVLEEDAQAFMIVTSASQVLGGGYKKLDSVDL